MAKGGRVGLAAGGVGEVAVLALEAAAFEVVATEGWSSATLSWTGGEHSGISKSIGIQDLVS